MSGARHGNLAIFVPHEGCPCRCSFCDQRGISGTQSLPDAARVAALCAQGARPGRADKMEIAFFGGSFTAIDRGYMVELLEAAFLFVQAGAYSGIRVSTRPDAIDQQTLSLLARYRVTAIELGAQSMDDRVLEKNRRGHTAAAVRRAAELVRAGGFSLGLQMMTGLVGADEQSDRETARRLAALRPDTVRIYPTIVLEKTDLDELWRAGEYRPQTLEEAVSLGAWLLAFFEEQKIRVIRMGLHAQNSLETRRTAGPYHPAFRELCEGRLLADRISAALAGTPAGGYRLRVAPESISKITGHGGYAVAYLRRLGYNIKIKPCDSLRGLEFRIEDV